MILREGSTQQIEIEYHVVFRTNKHINTNKQGGNYLRAHLKQLAFVNA